MEDGKLFIFGFGWYDMISGSKAFPPLQACLQMGERLYDPPHMEREVVLKAPRECGMWEERESTQCGTLRISKK